MVSWFVDTPSLQTTSLNAYSYGGSNTTDSLLRGAIRVSYREDHSKFNGYRSPTARNLCNAAVQIQTEFTHLRLNAWRVDLKVDIKENEWEHVCLKAQTQTINPAMKQYKWLFM